MNTKKFNNGVLYAAAGSFWWGVLGTYFFQYISFAGTLEVVVHRCIWTSFILFLTTIILKKWNLFKKIFSIYAAMFLLFRTPSSFNFLINSSFLLSLNNSKGGGRFA